MTATTMATVKTCAHPRCDHPIQKHELACRAHWFQLPSALRRKIWAAYKTKATGAHRTAITAAAHYWASLVAETTRPGRCSVCRTTTLFTDVDTGLPICMTCAKATLAETGRANGALGCDACHRPTDMAIESGDATYCPDCWDARR